MSGELNRTNIAMLAARKLNPFRSRKQEPETPEEQKGDSEFQRKQLSRLTLEFAPAVRRYVHTQREDFALWNRQRIEMEGESEIRSTPILDMTLGRLEGQQEAWAVEKMATYIAVSFLKREGDCLVRTSYIILTQKAAAKLEELAKSLQVLFVESAQQAEPAQ